MTKSTMMNVIEHALGAFVGSGEYALVDFPNYANPGDAAIWLGARKVLARLSGRQPAYVSSLPDLNVERCRQAVSGGTVFFLGGGNFGSLYSKHHLNRLKALTGLRDHKNVLLPLSMADTEDAEINDAMIAKTRHVLGLCHDLTVFSRERKTCRQLKSVYGIDAVMCPDTAHFCSVRPVIPAHDRIGLLRSDAEALSAVRSANRAPHLSFDWTDSRRLTLINRVGKLMIRAGSERVRPALFDLVARSKVQTAARLVGRGRTIVTDRLHGVILSSLMQRNVIAVDNSTGKVASYVDTWSEHLPGVSLDRPGA